MTLGAEQYFHLFKVGFVLFVIFCGISFLLMSSVLVRFECHGPLLVLRVPALCFWSLNRCHFTRPVYFNAVGAILNGSECPGEFTSLTRT